LANAKRHPREMGASEVEAFLSLLAVQGKVAASTQNQALSALLFLYRVVLGIQLPWMEGVVRAKRPKRVPTVLSQPDAGEASGQLLSKFTAPNNAMAATTVRPSRFIEA